MQRLGRQAVAEAGRALSRWSCKLQRRPLAVNLRHYSFIDLGLGDFGFHEQAQGFEVGARRVSRASSKAGGLELQYPN